MSTSNQETLDRLRAIRQKREPKKQKPIARVSEKRKAEIAEEKKLTALDKLFYLEVWTASPHVCQCGCGKSLGREPLTLFFHHLLPKAIYPQFRHTPENIMLLSPDCHSAVESNLDNRPRVRQRREEVYKLLIG